jgi:homoserine O-acetyltransferase
MNRCLGASRARFLVVSYNKDWLFPTPQSKSIVHALLEARRDVTFIELDSPHGHDAFLIDSELPALRQIVEPFLETTYRRVHGSQTDARQ